MSGGGVGRFVREERFAGKRKLHFDATPLIAEAATRGAGSVAGRRVTVALGPGAERGGDEAAVVIEHGSGEGAVEEDGSAGAESVSGI